MRSAAALSRMQGRLLAGMRTKARRGALLQHPPMGDVRGPDGASPLAPDEQAHRVIRLIFEPCEAHGSLHGLRRSLVAHDMRGPLRPPPLGSRPGATRMAAAHAHDLTKHAAPSERRGRLSLGASPDCSAQAPAWATPYRTEHQRPCGRRRAEPPSISSGHQLGAVCRAPAALGGQPRHRRRVRRSPRRALLLGRLARVWALWAAVDGRLRGQGQPSALHVHTSPDGFRGAWGPQPRRSVPGAVATQIMQVLQPAS